MMMSTEHIDERLLSYSFEKMDSDSEISSNTGNERNDSEEEELDSDDDSRVSEGGTHYVSFAPRNQYARLMKRLRTNNCPLLQVFDRNVLDLIFAHINVFCEAVSKAEGINCTVRRHSRGRCYRT